MQMSPLKDPIYIIQYNISIYGSKQGVKFVKPRGESEPRPVSTSPSFVSQPELLQFLKAKPAIVRSLQIDAVTMRNTSE